ncbi:EAL domain-containing response regulator [Salinicola acroporae]|uniref:Phytochrome-like protein cph2 n=1 Tax=Salinicola acroporae TaxID=1541440 RepID=A0ABT6I6L1_9GAMM|nr:EAL domain-containing response regulator [Salinicola acroporae]MDH4573264.1 phytochrome-like protein cph2 [Salinicola acroporae]
MSKLALVVDDDADIRYLCEHLLSQRGYRVDTAEGLEELARCPHRLNVDLILLDFSLGEFTGLDILEYLFDLKIDASILVISGCSHDVADRIIRYGNQHSLDMLGFLHKSKLVAELDRWLIPATGKPHAPTAEDLARGLAQRELFLVLQPKFDLGLNRVVGAEALVRWQEPSRGVLSPDVIIPLAERHEMIVELTWQVLGLACRQLQRWRRAGWDLSLSVNVPAAWIKSADLFEDFDSLIDQYDIAPRDLILEVTESTTLGCLGYARHILAGLRQRGCRLSLDDFGTGYSSLMQLHRLTFDELKVDRSFISRIEQDKRAEAIALSILDLGHRLDMAVVAEGIETPEQHALLRAAGYDLGQGFWLARPLSAKDFSHWYQQLVKLITPAL